MPIKKCPQGKILRKGHEKIVNDKKVKVPASCVKDVGLPGKGKPLFKLESGELSKHGYSDLVKLTKKQREIALKKIVKDLTPLTTFRKLNALSLVNRNTNPKLSKIFMEDRDFVKKNYMKN